MNTNTAWDLLVLGRTVLTMEDGAAPIGGGAVAIADGKIVEIGSASDLLEKAPTCELLDAGNCLVMPGLVNTHSHLAMSLLRGLADDLPLKTWLEEHIWPAEGQHMDRKLRAGKMFDGVKLHDAEQSRVDPDHLFGTAPCHAPAVVAVAATHIQHPAVLQRLNMVVKAVPF